MTMHQGLERPGVAEWRSGGVADNASNEQSNESRSGKGSGIVSPIIDCVYALASKITALGVSRPSSTPGEKIEPHGSVASRRRRHR